MKRHRPLRGLAFSLVVLLAVPATRDLIVAGAGWLLGFAVSAVMFTLGGLLMLLVVCKPGRRR